MDDYNCVGCPDCEIAYQKEKSWPDGAKISGGYVAKCKRQHFYSNPTKELPRCVKLPCRKLCRHYSGKMLEN